MSAESFLNHNRFFWLWTNLAGVFFCVGSYFFVSPLGGHRGGTLYGYTLGILATSGILYLMAYGIRKRSYKSQRTTVKGWLAAHVWLGISLLIVVPLHSGFQFGPNVHSLAYVLMVIVILSGIWGAVSYRTLASQIESNRGGASIKTLIEQFHSFAQKVDAISAGKSDQFLNLRNSVDRTPRFKLFSILVKKIPERPHEQKISPLLSQISESEKEDALQLLELSKKKHMMASTLQREIRTMAKLKLWLLFHLPISFALLAAVAIHIWTVLYY